MQGWKTRIRLWHKEKKKMMPSFPLWKADFYRVKTSEYDIMFDIGLTDKHGKRIYQGDKIKDEAGNIGEVDWDGLYASFYLAFPDGPREIDGTIMQWGEVVGNIYELVSKKT